MAKVTKLSLQNFKFFGVRQEFDLDGKNLLIYGENGSGKSSVYWAIYTLLECANKPDDTGIQKYFADGEQSLKNIFLKAEAPEYVDSQIVLELDDTTHFAVSAADCSIRKDADAQAANYASEFLNYKTLFRIHDFVHGDEIDLFGYFVKEVLPYVKFAPVKYWHIKPDGSREESATENANQIWELVKNPPPKESLDKNGNRRFPRKREPDFLLYQEAVSGFKEGLESLLTYTNTEGNPILANDFEGDFLFKLECVEVQPFKITAAKFVAPHFKIKLSIPDFHGAGTPILKPQSFLNEARLSALGLAMRFAILKKRLQTSKLKLALLDDFMVSLDMSNRDVALNYVFDKVAANYQTVILTHDRYFYEMAKDKLQRKGQKAIWKTYEMFEAFEDENNPTTSKPKPCIIEDKGKVEKAWALFRSKDYASAANMVRQAAEKLCKAYLTNSEQKDSNYNPKKLEELLKTFITKAIGNRIDAVVLADLKDYKDRIMNPNSHYDIETPLFKNELRKAIETLEELKTATGNTDL